MASASKTKISFWERFSYGCGDLGCNIIYSAMSAFLLFYYTDYVHVNAATIGTIMLLSRVFDGITDLIMFAIVSDTIEYGEWKTGYRTEGLINSASSFGFKVGNGLGSAILGWVIGAAGAGTGSEITFIWIPAILCIGQVIVMLFYHLDKEYDGIVADLAKEGEKENA